MEGIFTCEKVRENIISIMDPGGVRAFLIKGTQKAALIDTCCGLGNLKKLAEEMTDLPLIVLCTHGHVDHAGGAYGFDKVYLNKEDWDLAAESTTVESRVEFVNSSSSEPHYAIDYYIPQRKGDYQNMEDGQIFDLGGITLESIAVKGHTQGTMCFLIKEYRSLILGDACNPFTFLFFDEATDIRTFMESLKRLEKRYEDFDCVWFSHGAVEGPKSVISTVLDVCEEILSGKDDAVPMEFLGRHGIIAKAVDETNTRLDGKIGNVVYSVEKLEKA